MFCLSAMLHVVLVDIGGPVRNQLLDHCFRDEAADNSALLRIRLSSGLTDQRTPDPVGSLLV